MATLSKTVKIISFFSLLIFNASAVFGQAFCSLRDPLATINQLAPSPATFESSVIKIDHRARDFFIAETGLNMHRQELGYHTIYQVNTPDIIEKNIIHVRPESTPWGLIEIAWLLNNQGELKNFTFQRCRSQYCDLINNKAFKEKLLGIDQQALRSFLDESLYDVSTPGKQHFLPPEGSEPLVAAVLRSALKAAAIITFLEG
ncbi:MAG: hypothetical protein P8M71_01420 [Pseudomonadales bacterium]|nr:hypothetical protein [Pseudomonadales bacterium]